MVMTIINKLSTKMVPYLSTGYFFFLFFEPFGRPARRLAPANATTRGDLITGGGCSCSSVYEVTVSGCGEASAFGNEDSMLRGLAFDIWCLTNSRTAQSPSHRSRHARLADEAVIYN